MRRLALQHAAAAALPNKFTVAHLYFTPHGNYRRAALDRHSFEAIVVVVGVLRFGGHYSSIIRVVNHQVGVTANGDCAFSGEQTKKFCGTSAGSVDKTVQMQPAAFHSIGVQKVDAVFDSRNAVWNIHERILAEKFLFGVKRTMIRSYGIDRSYRPGLP